MQKKALFSVRSASFLAEAGCLCALMALLLVFPKESAAGVAQGLRLCYTSLIGSLLPFLVLSRLFLLRGLHCRLPPRCTFLTRKLFRLPPCCAGVVAFSMVGGYPVGASMTAQLFTAGEITRKQGQRMLLFCVGPGPAFVVSAVGAGLCGTAKAGAVLDFAVVLGAMLSGVVTRFFFREPIQETRSQSPPSAPPFAVCVSEAVRQSADAMLLICAFVALFSALLGVLDALSLPAAVRSGTAALLEVTNACDVYAKKGPLPLLAAIIAWGGVCTHCQLAPSCAALGLPYWRFALGRALHAGLSFLCCRAMLCFIRLPVNVLAQNAAFRPAAKDSGLLSFCMIMMCALLLFGSHLSIRLQKGACFLRTDVLQ